MTIVKHHPKKGRQLKINFSAEGNIATGGYDTEILVRHAVEATLDYENFKRNAEVSVTFCDGETIRKLNAEYRQKDTATDVLSFPMFDFSEEVDEIDDEYTPLGDIVLNLERAGEQADAYGHTMEHEIAFLTIHSTLHLLGYDHERSEAEEEDMFHRQKEIVYSLPIDHDAYDLTESEDSAKDGEEA